jgi:hypothetical protein
MLQNIRRRAAGGYTPHVVPRLSSFAMSRLLLLLAICAAVACSATKGSRSIERVEPQPPIADLTLPRHADLDLSGPWATGSVGEPDVTRIVMQLQCNYTPPLWVIDQRGDTVRAWAIPESRAQGVRARDPVMSVAAVGRLSGVDLAMTLGQSRYQLRYDSTSGHLRGTLNGVPFWAVRQQLVRPQNCIPVP